MICPLMKVECLKTHCAWYTNDECSIVAIHWRLNEIAVALENK